MFSDDALEKVLCDLKYHIPTIDWRIVLDERPDLVQEEGEYGYPLVDACEFGLSLSVIQELVERFPEAVVVGDAGSSSDSDTDTPLFKACYLDEPDLDTIAYLVKQYPHCLIGNATRPPLLHHCISINDHKPAVSVALVDWVWKQFPMAADLPDFHGRYLIHHATASRGVERFRKLLLRTPTSCLIDQQNGGGHLLHYAVANLDREAQNVNCILEECPTAIPWANHRGEWPAHVAVLEPDRKLLVEQYPFALLHMAHAGETVLGNARREITKSWFVGVDDSDDDYDEDDDWALVPLPSTKTFRNYPTIHLLRHLDELFDILIHKVISPLRQIVTQSCKSGTGTCLPSDIMNNILRFAVPHYEEAIKHTPNYIVETAKQKHPLGTPAALDERKCKIPRLE